MKEKQSLFKYMIIIMFFSIIVGCTQRNEPNISGEKVREYANALYNRELYEQAVREYQRYLDLYHIDEQQQANIHFIIGNIYFERLHDYENALAHYLKIKHVYPESSLTEQTSRQIVACLERLQRSADAKQALDEAAYLDPETVQESRPGTVIAKIEDREITSGDLDYNIKQLPEYVQSQVQTREARLEFLQQYVATELFYDAAKRQSLDKDKEVLDGTFQAKKSLMVQKYLQNEIASRIEVKPDDVELYYKANQDKYTEKDDKGNVKRQKTFSEVQQQAAEDYVRDKQQKLYMELMQNMLRADNVVIYDDRVK